MNWVLAFLIVAVLGVTYILTTNNIGEMPEAPLDEPVPAALTASGPLSADDLRGIEFPVVTRGYSMRQVDELLERLAEQLAGPSEISVEGQSVSGDLE